MVEISESRSWFPQVLGTKLSMVTVSLYEGLPPIRILFTYTAERVNLVAVDFEPEEDRDE